MNLDRIIAVRTGKTVYRDGETVVKLFDQDYSKANVLNEALNQARVEETGLNIPHIREVTKVDGKWAIVLDYIEGKTLDRLMKENPQKNDEYLEKFVDLQIEIMKKKHPLLTKIKDKMNLKICQAPLDATTRYELHTRLDGMSKDDKVCHGDYNPSNVIITPDGEPCVLDWAHVTQGNPASDVARTYLLFWLDGDLKNAEKYVNMYCAKTDTPKKDVERWVPIVASSQLLKDKKVQEAFLMHWVNVVDYE